MLLNETKHSILVKILLICNLLLCETTAALVHDGMKLNDTRVYTTL